MVDYSFVINWKNNQIVYFPVSGEIVTANSKQNIKLNRNIEHQSSTYDRLSSVILKDTFNPFCLTLYPSNYCNLACSYCYAYHDDSLQTSAFNYSALNKAAEMVAQSCRAHDKPLILGFHGGNEPLLSREFIMESTAICKQFADRYHLPLLSFCTTNGVISRDTAEWAAGNFTGITLSWDGPPEFHDKYRRDKKGNSTSADVQRTAEIFINSPQLKQFKIRATVTRDSVNSLSDIVQFFFPKGIKWIDIYPIYQNKEKAIPEHMIPDKISFVKNFLLARKWARRHGINFVFAGSRLADCHDRFCPIYQHNLTMTPDGFLTSCFLATHNLGDKNVHFMYGHGNDDSIIDQIKLSSIYSKHREDSLKCKECFNFFHCSKMCPEFCPLENSGERNLEDCIIEKWIGLANIIEAAGYELTDDDLHDSEDFFNSIKIDRKAEEASIG